MEKMTFSLTCTGTCGMLLCKSDVCVCVVCVLSVVCSECGVCLSVVCVWCVLSVVCLSVVRV